MSLGHSHVEPARALQMLVGIELKRKNGEDRIRIRFGQRPEIWNLDIAA